MGSRWWGLSRVREMKCWSMWHHPAPSDWRLSDFSRRTEARSWDPVLRGLWNPLSVLRAALSFCGGHFEGPRVPKGCSLELLEIMFVFVQVSVGPGGVLVGRHSEEPPGVSSQSSILVTPSPSQGTISDSLDWWHMEKDMRVCDQPFLDIILRTHIFLCVRGTQKSLARLWPWRESLSVYQQSSHEISPKEFLFLLHVTLKADRDLFLMSYIPHGCFSTVVPEKTLQSPLDSKEIEPVNPKGNQPEYSLERLMLKLQYFGHLKPRANSLEKNLMLQRFEGRRRMGQQRNEMAGWHHWLNGHEFEQTPGDSEGQGSLACCGPWIGDDLVTRKQQ